MKKRAIDKVRAIDLMVYESSRRADGIYYAVLYYDVRKLKRLSDDDLTEILFEKTLKLYPFAVINKCATRFKSKRTAIIEMHLPLNPDMRITKVPEGE